MAGIHKRVTHPPRQLVSVSQCPAGMVTVTVITGDQTVHANDPSRH
jgi:hypothetical protein